MGNHQACGLVAIYWHGGHTIGLQQGHEIAQCFICGGLLCDFLGGLTACYITFDLLANVIVLQVQRKWYIQQCQMLTVSVAPLSEDLDVLPVD